MDHLLEWEEFIFESESKYGLSDEQNIKKVENAIKSPNFLKQYVDILDSEGVILEIDEWSDKKTVEIKIIEIPKDKAKGGIGSSVMRTIITWANEFDKVLTLKPAGGSRISRPKLIAWYSKLGFIMNKGKDEKDDLLLMYKLAH